MHLKFTATGTDTFNRLAEVAEEFEALGKGCRLVRTEVRCLAIITETVVWNVNHWSVPTCRQSQVAVRPDQSIVCVGPGRPLVHLP